MPVVAHRRDVLALIENLLIALAIRVSSENQCDLRAMTKPMSMPTRSDACTNARFHFHPTDATLQLHARKQRLPVPHRHP